MTTADQINIAIAIATTCSAIVSLVVAVVTYMIVRANREAVAVMGAQLEATTRPYIQVTPMVREMSTFLELRIMNAGASAATDLRLTLDKDYHFNAEEGEAKNLKKYTAFSQPIESLPPKAELNLSSRGRA